MNFNCNLEMEVEGKPLDSSLDSEDIAVPIKENVEKEYEEKEIDESINNLTENNNDLLPEKESDLVDKLLDLKITNNAEEEKTNVAVVAGQEADLMTNSNLVMADDLQMKDEENKETLESDYGYKIDVEEGSCQLSAVKDQINQDPTNHGQEAEDAASMEIGTLHLEDYVNYDSIDNERNAEVEDKGADSGDSDEEADNEGFTVIKEDTNDDDKESSSSSEGEDDLDSEDSQEDKEEREPRDDLDVPLIPKDEIENVTSYEELGIEKVEQKIVKRDAGDDNKSVIGEELKFNEVCSEMDDKPAECNVLDTSFSNPAELCSKLDLHKKEESDIESESSDVEEEKQDENEKEGRESRTGSRRSSIASLSEKKEGEMDDFDAVPRPIDKEYEKDTTEVVDKETKYIENDAEEEKQDKNEKEGRESETSSRRSSIASLSENKGGEMDDIDAVPGPIDKDNNAVYEKDTTQVVDQETKSIENETNFGLQLENCESAKTFDKHEGNLDSVQQSDLMTQGDEDEDCSNQIDGDYQRVGSEFVMNESMVTNISEGKIMDFELNEQIDDFDEQNDKNDSDMKLAEQKLAKFMLDEEDTLEQKIDKEKIYEEEQERKNEDTKDHEVQEQFEDESDLYDNREEHLEHLEALSVKTPNPSYTSTENIEDIETAKPLSQSGLEFGLNELAAQQRESCYTNNEPGTCLELVEGAAAAAASSEHLVSLVEMTENAADLSPLSPALSPAGFNIQTMEEEGTTDTCLKETEGKIEVGEENVSMETSTMESEMVAKSLDNGDVEVTFENGNHTSRDSSDDEDIQEMHLKESKEIEDLGKLEGQRETCEMGTGELSHQDAVLQEDYQHEVLSKFVENEPVYSDNEDKLDDEEKDKIFEEHVDMPAKNFTQDQLSTPDQTPVPKPDHNLENTACENEYQSESNVNDTDLGHNELDREMEEKHSEPMEPEKKEIFDCFEKETTGAELSLQQYSEENMAKVEDNTKLVDSDFEEESEGNKSELPLINYNDSLSKMDADEEPEKLFTQKDDNMEYDSQKDNSSDMVDKSEPQEIYENESFVLNSFEKNSVSEEKMEEIENTDIDMKPDNIDTIEIEHNLNGEKPFSEDAAFEIGDENQIVSKIDLQTQEQKLTPEFCQVIENEPLMSSDGLEEEKPQQIVETTSELEITKNGQKEDTKDDDPLPTNEVAPIIATTISPEDKNSQEIVEPVINVEMTESDPIIVSKEEDPLPIIEVATPEPINATDFEEKSQPIVEPTSNIKVTENDTIEESKDDDSIPVAVIAAATTATVAAVAAATAAKTSDSKTKTESDKKAGKPGSGKSAVSGKPAPGLAPKKKAETAAKSSPSRSGPGGPSKPTTSAKRPTVPPVKSATTSAQKTTAASAARPGTAQKPLTNGTSSRPTSAAAPRPTNRPTTRPTAATKSTTSTRPTSSSRTTTAKPASAKPAATKPATSKPTPPRPATTRPATTRPTTTRPTTNPTTTTPKTPLSSRPASTKPSSAPPRATSRPTTAKSTPTTPSSRTTTARPSSSTRPRPTTGPKTETSKTSSTTTRTPATRTPLSKPSPRTPTSAPAASKTPSKAPTSARPASTTAGAKRPTTGQTKTPTSRPAGKKLPASGGSSKPVPIKKPGKGEDLGKTEVSVEENVLIEEEKPVNGGLSNGLTNGVHDEKEAESVVTNGCNGALDCSEPVH